MKKKILLGTIITILVLIPIGFILFYESKSCIEWEKGNATGNKCVHKILIPQHIGKVTTYQSHCTQWATCRLCTEWVYEDDPRVARIKSIPPDACSR